MKTPIVVVGSSNTDMVLKTERFPRPGETLVGADFFIFPGGKGANQAVAAARLGGDVHFICRVGNDAFGHSAINGYIQEGINVTGIVKDTAAPTGVAVITVNSGGENSIIVASGANAFLSVADLKRNKELLQTAGWIITQLETPLPVIVHLAAYAKQAGKKLVLNPAPATSLPDVIYRDLYLITPNESEAELLTGISVQDEAGAIKAAAALKAKGVRNVIITLGSRGAFAGCEGFTGMVSVPKVKVVDTTAAGDVFNGALVVALSENKDWKEAIDFACKAAAFSVTRMGAQTSAPLRAELEEMVAAIVR